MHVLHVRTVNTLIGEIKRYPSLFEDFTEGHGIIAMRERFLELLGTDEGKRGKKKAETDDEATQPPGKEFNCPSLFPALVRVAFVYSRRRLTSESNSIKAEPQSRSL